MTMAPSGDTGTSPFGTSPFDISIVAITASDDEIRAHLAEAEVPPLLPAIAYATGDLSLLRDDLRPDPLLVAMPQGGLGEDQLAEARELAAQALIRFRDGGSVAAAPPGDDMLLRIKEDGGRATGNGRVLALLEEEVGYRGEDRRAPDWRKDEVAPGVDFKVAVIGAGMSGLLAAH